MSLSPSDRLFVEKRERLARSWPVVGVTLLALVAAFVVAKNADGTTDIYFGPKPPEGMASNWVQTVPGRGWFTILHLYSPLQPWFDKTWRPGEIELVK